MIDAILTYWHWFWLGHGWVVCLIVAVVVGLFAAASSALSKPLAEERSVMDHQIAGWWRANGPLHLMAKGQHDANDGCGPQTTRWVAAPNDIRSDRQLMWDTHRAFQMGNVDEITVVNRDGLPVLVVRRP